MLDRLRAALGLDGRAAVTTIERALTEELRREQEEAVDAGRQQLAAEIERLARERDTAVTLHELEIAQLHERRRVRAEEDAIDVQRIAILEAEQQAAAAPANVYISRLEHRLELTAPLVLDEFLAELRDVARKASAERRFMAGDELIRDFWRGPIPGAILSNRQAVDRIHEKIHLAEGEVRKLQRLYMPPDQLAARIAELRASIPDLSTCDEMIEETGDAA
jgi:hypothetical protein